MNKTHGKLLPFFLMAIPLAFTACKNSTKTKSLEEVYEENGKPVVLRTIKPESFSIFVKYPADLKLNSQSVAEAKLNDVVREVYAKVGDYVERDQVILAFSKDNAMYSAAKIQFDNAKVVYERASKLYKSADISRMDFDNARAEYNIAKESLKANDDMIYVKAPISGKITQMNVRVSSNVKAGDSLFSVGNQNGYEASFWVLPSEIDGIRPGERAFISVGKDGEKIEGRVSEVGLSMDPNVRAFLVKADFEGDSKYLSSGMHVDVDVETYNDPNAIVLKQKEMIRTLDQWSCFVVENNIAKKVELGIGYIKGQDYCIDDGLENGVTIISEGAQFVRDGMKVLAANEMTSSEKK